MKRMPNGAKWHDQVGKSSLGVMAATTDTQWSTRAGAQDDDLEQVWHYKKIKVKRGLLDKELRGAFRNVAKRTPPG